MSKQALKPSPTLARLLSSRREELGLTTRDVSSRTAKMGERIPYPTLTRIEQGSQEPGVRRFYALVKLYGIPLEIVPDLLELEQLAAEPPRETNADLVLSRGIEHWNHGELGPALAHLFAFRQLAPAGPEGTLQRHKGLLAFAIAASGLGRNRLAHALVEQILTEGPDEGILPNVLIQSAINWMNLRSVPMALAVLREAEERAGGDASLLGMIAHNRAEVLLLAKRPEDASREIEMALRLYGEVGGPWNRSAALGVRIRLLFETGRPAEALEAAREALRVAERHGFAPFVVRRTIDEGRALYALDQTDAGIDRLLDALSEAVRLRDSELQFRAHFWLWKAFRSRGLHERAEFELGAARFHGRQLQDSSLELREIREMDPGGTHDPTRPRRRRRRRT